MGADISRNQNNEVEAELQALSRGLTHLIFRNVQLVEEINSFYGCESRDTAGKVEI